MSVRKIVLLILAFCLPISIFLFLKIFGKNQFDVPPLFEDKVLASEGCKGISYKTPYVIPDSVWSKLSAEGNPKLLVASFEHTRREQTVRQLNRVRTEFRDAPVSVQERAHGKLSDLEEKCFLFVSQDSAVVLMDGDQRIRGYYNGSSLDDMDRLIVEIKIILEK